MVGSDTDLDYLDRAARHFDATAGFAVGGVGYWQCVRPGESLELADGATISNYGNEDAFIKLDANGSLWQEGGNRLELVGGNSHTVPKVSYPPLPVIERPVPVTATAISVAEENAEAWAETDYPKLMRAKIDIDLERCYQATIKAKDEIIAALNADISKLLAINGAEYGRANRAEEESRNLHDRLMHACEELDRLKNGEPDKPSTRDMSRLGHFGESHAKNGLSLFDRYY